MSGLSQIINYSKNPIVDKEFIKTCRETMLRDGALILADFLTINGLAQIQTEARNSEGEAYFCQTEHNVFLNETDDSYASDHPRNVKINSSKGCICDDQITENSALRSIYESEEFKLFLCQVLGEENLHPYADALSSINIHYAKTGQELGWHFDNSAFAITLLIQKPDGGSKFQYWRGARSEEFDDFDAIGALLDGNKLPNEYVADAGTLMLFNGKYSMHRVTPTEGERTRMLAVLAYNSQAGISLSANARQTFYGRLQ